ncbi:MAG: ABC transporter ATP-binding protein/permease [Methanobrevibacter sp.]|nr:ABC transporter ATP-binding protein/permease [Methanobrevibacter sp.]
MLKILKSYLKPYMLSFIGVIIFQVLQASILLYLPTLNAEIIDNGVITGNIDYIWNHSWLMMIIVIGQIIFSTLAKFFGTKVSLAIERDVRMDLYSRIQDFSVQESNKFGVSTLITRATNDIQQFTLVLSLILTIIVNIPIMFVGGITMALLENIKLSVVVIASFPIIILISIIFNRKINPLFESLQKQIDRITEILRDQITGVKVVKAFVKESTERKRFSKVNLDLYDLNIATGRLLAIIFPTFMFIANLSILGIMWYGGILVYQGDMQIGGITAFIIYMSYIMTAILMAATFFGVLTRGEVSAKRILEVLNAKTTIYSPKNPVVIKNPKGLIEFKGVDFSYLPINENVEPILKQINFTAQPGETTAIIGSTGSGKSTLLQLIPRLYDVTEGIVSFDGINIRKMSIDDLNSYISIIPQKSFLFSGTIADNLRLSKSDASDEELWKVLKIAQVNNFINNLKDGLESEVVQGGSNFSGGQRQRITIARALLRDSKVLIFDDSFSALDYTTDVNLRKALAQNIKDSTIIIVDQRISTIRNADKILVMDNGKIIGSGKHDELFEKCRIYKEIVNSQLNIEEDL